MAGLTPLPSTSTFPNYVGCWGCVRAPGPQPEQKVVLPLTKLGVELSVLDVCCSISLHQTYHNVDTTNPLEVSFKMDVSELEDKGFVGAFEAHIDGRIVKGQIQSKDEARDTYDDAIASGQTAALMEKDKQGTFTAKLGNLPPNKTCTITLTFFTQVCAPSE